MKQKYKINAVPLVAIALVGATSCTPFFSPDANQRQGSGDRPKVVNVPAHHQIPQSEEWQVVRVTDGDTITVRQGSRKEKIRFCGVDSDERKSGGRPAQSIYADQAKNYLQQLISQSSAQVAITMIEQDRYGRWVGEVWINPGTDNEELANGLLVLNGLARTYPKYLSQCPNAEVLQKAEADARAKRAGVWRDPYSIPPWEFRKQQRQNRGS